MMRLADLIKGAGIRKRYFLYGRSDTIARRPDPLKAWRDVGLERVFVGLKFARDEDLAYVRKQSTASDNEKAVKILQDLGLDIYASLMVRPVFGAGFCLWGTRIRVSDSHSFQDSGRSPASLCYGSFVLIVAEIDVHDPHGPQQLPCFLSQDIDSRRLQFLLQRAVKQKRQGSNKNVGFRPMIPLVIDGAHFDDIFKPGECSFDFAELLIDFDRLHSR